jgi:peptide/nickel transport system substrate-binding protein
MSCWRHQAAGHNPGCVGSAVRALLIALPICFSSNLASTNAATVPSTPQRGGVLEFAVDAEPPNYDCHANISFAFIHPIAPHYSTLLKFDTANYPQVQGDLAESWTVSPDRQTYTFKLHPNILFHDGSRLKV